MQWESNDGGYMEGGGGYMESQSTPQKQGAGSNSRDNQTLTPLTVRQLVAAIERGDDNPQVDGKELSNIHLVGLLTEVAHNSTTISFVLNDGTGTFPARYFLQGEDDPYQQQLVESLVDGVYVSTVGTLRSFGGKTSLSSFTVIPVENFNQVTHHFLECIYTHLRNVNGPQGGANAPKQDFNMGDQSSGFGGGFNAFGGGQSSKAFGAQATNYNNYGASDSGFSDPAQQAILDILGASSLDMGLSVDQIKQQLQGRLSDAQLRDALNYLTNEGHIYSTIDENHFKRTA
ncbi:Aste57867_17298 [Aphanomyces stellatus]|uniref:Aste57867_17298 protein n=1 Tax=Aphanomyces stellatus TaxID=120398 RepID=A0A485KF52_9STRA|nr:hypothetical protein As57867_017239 [Aphanomyces stellatus]KAF0713644.1 hypothetical protein As57867_004255 [Aphanomyces stellatus]VFT81381.1 Aste57867_4266 [Aphanomyces stellatus]VFT94054.1 Aste57867_17298 [Aphanomyces stellatus]